MRNNLSINRDDLYNSEIALDKNFNFATSFIKIISILMSVIILLLSKYAFIFFMTAMLPSIIALFIDHNRHRCFSATMCSFNLIATMPYILKIWQSNDIDFTARSLILDFNNWLIIFSMMVAGWILYILIPAIICKINLSRHNMQLNKYQEQIDDIKQNWSIKIDNFNKK